MKRKRIVFLMAGFVVTLGMAVSSATRTAGQQTKAAAIKESGKIPITTSSNEAKKEFMQGRDLADKLLIQDSIRHFDKAISLDPSFASAELSRANTSPTAREFFEHLAKAVSLADKASNGEKLLILVTEAGANGNIGKQKEYLDELVAAYPNDERAQFALGGYYFGQADFTKAIWHYKKATEVGPTFSNAYNLLGYAYRQNENYSEAEQAFKKYIELIPKDPNPYDSYAELLLKMGRYNDSIVQYRKALAIDQKFINSHFGIAAALMYSGKHSDAIAELQKITDKARSDGERRTALFGMTVVEIDAGNFDKALALMDQQYSLGEKTNDVPNMVGDLQLKGNILLEMGKVDEASALFDRALKMTDESNLSQQIKDNTRLFDRYNRTRVAIGKKDLTTARTEAAEFWKGAAASNNPFQVKQSHELNGMIALEEKDFAKAIAELQQSNLQNPYDLYRMCLAYRGSNDAAKAKEFCGKAAGFNSLPQANLAFVRMKAMK